MQEINVVAGVIVKDDKIILAKRKEDDALAGKWEFPGGKIEEGEDPFQALVREIREELGIDVEPLKLLLTVKHRYPEKQVKLHFILAKTSQRPEPIECAECREIELEEIEKMDLAPADRKALSLLKDVLSVELKNY